MTNVPKNDDRNTLIFGLSRFDAAVIASAGVIVLAVIIIALIGQPQPIGDAVVYLSPADGGNQNLYLTTLDEPDTPRQLTDVDTTIYDFGVSEDGQFIAYSQREETTGLNDLYLMNLQTRQVQQLTDCAAELADCRTPVFRPGGGLIAYERVESNRDIAAGPGAIRIWLVDMRSQPFSTFPLDQDSQVIGYQPQWSGDGTSLAFYSPEVNNPGVIVYNFLPDANEEASFTFIPSSHGTVGSLSPDGDRLLVPDVARLDATTLATYLRLADVSAGEIADLTGPGEPLDDSVARWHPDGVRAVVERRYFDDRYTRGYQLYLLDTESGDVEPLVVDERFSHGFAYWDKTGEKLVFQRFQLVNAEGEPVTNADTEVWVYDLETDELIQIAANAFHPRWLQDS